MENVIFNSYSRISNLDVSRETCNELESLISLIQEKNKVDMNINEWKIRLENLYENKRIPQTMKFKKNDISLKLVITKWMN